MVAQNTRRLRKNVNKHNCSRKFNVHLINIKNLSEDNKRKAKYQANKHP